MPKRGFTLVELLVVISIIAILSLIGLTVYTNVQKNARDAKRKADIDSIANALEVNYNKTVPNSYDAVRSIFFSSGTVPKDPTSKLNYIYPGGVQPTDDNNSGGRSDINYTVCADLEADGVWSGTNQDYCRSDQQ